MICKSGFHVLLSAISYPLLNGDSYILTNIADVFNQSTVFHFAFPESAYRDIREDLLRVLAALSRTCVSYGLLLQVLLFLVIAAIKSTWWNSGNGYAWTFSKRSLTGILSSASRRSFDRFFIEQFKM